MFFSPRTDLKGNCVGHDPEIFFAASGRGYMKAKKICEGCPVAKKCLDKAIAEEEPGQRRYGVFGGLGGRERSRLLGEANAEA